MTAFARLSAPVRSAKWIVELRSVNHRYFDLSLKLPPSFYPLEARIRDLVQKAIRRGKITLAVIQENGEAGVRVLSLDEGAVRSYLAAIQKLKRRFRLEGELAVKDLLQLPGLFSVEKGEEDPERGWNELQGILRRVLSQAIRAKEMEGRKLAKDVTARLRKIAAAMHRVEARAAGAPKRAFEKLLARLEELLREKEKDPDRVAREVAFLAERSDITEEIVRMRSHLKRFGERLATQTEVGRELDFLCQEMNREINTVGSKAQLFEISTEVVFVKGELEKIREQIQNVE